MIKVYNIPVNIWDVAYMRSSQEIEWKQNHLHFQRGYSVT